ncbi:hypothetical protein NKI96_10800 [Mesorhizobium sp. M0292]|uniref:hypothetical protein n=1 Tax=Mesorhizobium sp. M0292 TaxID=2956929 RepID=UPI00333AEB47
MMLRYSYEWIEGACDDDGEQHWTDQLYAIFDGKVGLADEQAIAWAYSRDGAEQIVAALNGIEEQRQRAAIVWQLAKRRDQFDLSDLLS